MMTPIRHFLILLIAVCSFVPKNSNAQKKGTLGATTLTLSGTPEAYSFEKIVNVAGVPKKELYERIKTWIRVNLKTNKDNVYFDDESYDAINATVVIAIKDCWRELTNQKIEFKMSFSFKDDKLKCNVNSFLYYGIQGGPHPAAYQKSFEDLEPLRNVFQRGIYEDFDMKFNALIASMENAASTPVDNEW